MSSSPPAVLVVGASREADVLREMLDDRSWHFVGLNDCETAGAMVIAPHPFDSDLMAHGLAIARDRNLPFVVLVRTGWVAHDQDNWHRVPDAAGAARKVGQMGWRHILLAVGQARQPAFDGLVGCMLHIRRQGAQTGFDGRHEILGAMGPFTVQGERRLLRDLQIDAVVAHDAGGQGGWPKIEAARLQALPVVLIDRPAPPDTMIVETPAQALSWLCRL